MPKHNGHPEPERTTPTTSANGGSQAIQRVEPQRYGPQVSAQIMEPRAGGTPEPYPNTYCGSYSTSCFFKNATNSSSKLRLR